MDIRLIGLGLAASVIAPAVVGVAVANNTHDDGFARIAAALTAIAAPIALLGASFLTRNNGASTALHLMGLGAAAGAGLIAMPVIAATV